MKNPSIFKISAFVIISLTFFYLGKHWSDGYSQLIFFNETRFAPSSVSISPNHDKPLNVSSLIEQNLTSAAPEKVLASAAAPAPAPAPSPILGSSPPPPPPPSPPPPSDSVQRFGIVTENGTMADEFEVGDVDPEFTESWGNESETGTDESTSIKIRIKKFSLCPQSMKEYIPCLDNVAAIKKLKSTKKGEKFERHCPDVGGGLNCLVPAPKGYRIPIPWPRSRDEVLFCIVHTFQFLCIIT